MKSYTAIFRMKFIAGLQYRAAAWAGVATQFAFGFMYIMIFRAFYRSSGAAPPMEWRELICYCWLRQAFLAIYALWNTDNDLLDGITSGAAAYELLRPYDVYAFWFMRTSASRVSSAALKCVPLLTVTFLLPGDFRMQPPPNAGALALFAASQVIALALVGAVSMFIYILTFITLQSNAAKYSILALSEFLMGAYVPIPLMPKWLQLVTAFFPFRYMSDLPFRLYSGNIAGADAYFQISVQLAWTVALIALGKWAFSRVTSRIVIQGG